MIKWHLFLENPTPQKLHYILCWVTTPRVKSITKKQFPAQLWLHGGCPDSGNALDVGITVHIMPWTSGPTSIQRVIQRKLLQKV
jgi:hypothetical protein